MLGLIHKDGLFIVDLIAKVSYKFPNNSLLEEGNFLDDFEKLVFSYYDETTNSLVICLDNLKK